MKEQIISFETAKLAKERGFIIDKNPLYFKAYKASDKKALFSVRKEYRINYKEEYFTNLEWQDYYLFPTQSQLQKWIREKHNILLTILPWKDHEADANDNHTFRPMLVGVKTFEEFKTWEEALEVGLFESLKLIKDEL